MNCMAQLDRFEVCVRDDGYESYQTRARTEVVNFNMRRKTRYGIMCSHVVVKT